MFVSPHQLKIFAQPNAQTAILLELTDLAATNDTHKLVHACPSLLLSETQIYKRIAGLSYLADIRVGLGAEHPRKVEAIVEGNVEGCVVCTRCSAFIIIII